MAQEIKQAGSGGGEARCAITVLLPRSEVYRFWRNFENLTFMQHLESVQVLDEKRSRWVAKAGNGNRLEWEAEIVREVENELLEWKTTQGTERIGGGMVRFADAPGDRGTEVQVAMRYDVPGGGLGAAFLKMWKEHPVQIVRDDLRRFKQLLETGEIPTTVGQPMGS